MPKRDFLRDALELVRRRSRQIDTEDPNQLLHLAAHLFAVASLLPKRGTAGLVVDPRQLAAVPRSVEALREELGSLPPSIGRSRLFSILCNALQVLDRDIGLRWKGSTGSAEARVEVRGQGACRLGSEVVIWLRHQSAFRLLRRQRFELADRSRRTRPQALGPHPARFLTLLGMAWNSDPQQPFLEPWVGPLNSSPLVEESGRDATERGCFRVALCPLDVDAHPQFRAFQHDDDGGCYFQALGPNAVAGSGALNEHLKRLMDAAVDQEVHLLVLPELMVSSAARQLLLDYFRHNDRSRFPYGVIAGSFHIWDSSSGQGVDWPVNESPTFSRSGEVLLRHHKRGRFRVSSDQVRADSRFFPERGQPCPEQIVDVFEGIRHEASLRILETTLGRLAVAICADCIAPDRTRLTEAISRLDPDLLIIVSMSPQTAEFEEIMQSLARSQVGSLFVNARRVCSHKARQLLAAMDLALWEPAGAPPTRMRWVCGSDEPEVRYYNPLDAQHDDSQEVKEQRRGWRPISQALGDTGMEMLNKGTDELGLVVDLGVHWRWTG